MAYVPPHKRHSKESGGPSPVPALPPRQFRKGLNFRAPKTNADRSGKIVYADMAISRWLTVGLDADRSVLKPFSVETFGRRSGENPLALGRISDCSFSNEILLCSRYLELWIHVDFDGILGFSEDDETRWDHSKKPWEHIAETVMQDLVSSFEVVRSEIKGQSMEEIKPTLVARFGAILFRGSPSFPVEACGDMVTEASMKRLKRSFYAYLPSFYMENVTQRIIAETDLSFEDEKDIYQVKLSDKSRPDATISCKCSVSKADQRLELYKVELNQVQHMVVDVSCLKKDLDMRLMLGTKRILTAISENEKNSIRDLITSAILDSSVKGGLRWPLGKASSGDRYSVVGVWHTISTTYKNSSMRLKVRHADRFDFGTSRGKVTEEIILKLKGITSELHGQSLGTDSICDMLKDALRMMWEHFLSCGNAVI